MRIDLEPSKPWVDGGTGITNFPPEDLPVYEEAIKQYGDSTLFVMNKPMAGYEKVSKGYCSFHQENTDKLKENNGCLQKFWDLFDKIQGKFDKENSTK